MPGYLAVKRSKNLKKQEKYVEKEGISYNPAKGPDLLFPGIEGADFANYQT